MTGTRQEDRPLLTGDATFVDDRRYPDTARLAVLRSRYGHARIDGIDASAASARDGILDVVTAGDLDADGVPGRIPVEEAHLDADVPGHPILARERVRYQGEPIAAVVAEDRYTARDALDAIAVDYERLDAVTDVDAAIADGAPAVHGAAPDNLAVEWRRGNRAAVEAAIADAAHVVEVDLENNRLLPTAIEPRAALARHDPADDRLTVHLTTQAPHRHRSKLSATLGVPERRIRVHAPSVGGGFGHKAHHHPGEALAAWCALRLERPVKWVATRSENALAGAHARDHRTSAALALDSAGAFRALRVDTTANLGAYALGAAPELPTEVYGSMLSGQYAIPEVHARVRVAFTNTAPVHAYRGAGQPEASYAIERLAGAAARELGVDPVELRRRNQIETFPHETATGTTYDSGNYARALDAANYDDLRERSGDDRRLGVGLSCFVEATAVGPFETGAVRVHPDGSVTVAAGTHSHGQGHGTTYAELVAGKLGVPADDIEVVEGDTDRVPAGIGTFASRSAAVGGSAVVRSAERVIEKARRIAADRLEVVEEDVAFEDGTFSVAGAPDRSLALADVASMAYGGARPGDEEPGLEATTAFEPPETAVAFGTHVAAVAVDPRTGDVSIERYVAVHDCGERLEPTIVEGQVHGGTVQGIGQALSERAAYDDAGNLATASLGEYAIPKAADVPDLETDATVTPSPHNPLGAKGVGQSGAIGAPPAVVDAVLDALAPLGVDQIDMPLTPERVWRACRDAE